jgi:hypothetical protein
VSLHPVHDIESRSVPRELGKSETCAPRIFWLCTWLPGRSPTTVREMGWLGRPDDQTIQRYR